MRKFKHITGEIAQQVALDFSPDRFYWCKKFGSIHINLVENSSEWEEIIDKDYEILSFVCKYTKDLWLPHYSNLKKWSRQGKLTSPYTLENINNHSNYSINSIKRLNDNEIFTIGDSIKHKNGKIDKGLISQFRISSNDQSLLVEYIGVYNNEKDFRFSNSLCVLEKLVPKNPLFKTEDGVQIFEGDNFYIINEYFTYNIQKAVSKSYGDITLWSKDKTIFSTKEKAEDYILMNKPCISINDLIKLNINNDDDDELTSIELYIDKLKQLVKSKL